MFLKDAATAKFSYRLLSVAIKARSYRLLSVAIKAGSYRLLSVQVIASRTLQPPQMPKGSRCPLPGIANTLLGT